MGVLRYGLPERLYAFDDRTLTHLAVAVFEELRRGEAFAFSFNGDEGPTTLVMSRDVPLRFDFAHSAPISINGDWVRALESAAHTVEGLEVVAEPARTPLTAEHRADIRRGPARMITPPVLCLSPIRHAERDGLVPPPILRPTEQPHRRIIETVETARDELTAFAFLPHTRNGVKRRPRPRRRADNDN